jgi:hypothetical protein
LKTQDGSVYFGQTIQILPASNKPEGEMPTGFKLLAKGDLMVTDLDQVSEDLKA